MKYAYPAVFTEEDGKVLVSVPDLKGCHTFGDTLAEAIEMAQDATEMVLYHMEKDGVTPPQPSTLDDARSTDESPDAFASFVYADTDEYRRRCDKRAVNKMVTIPAWLKYQAEQANAPFSQILQQGLKDYLDIAA
jgi:predicted RNase H-like HicB family nuclease